MKTIFVGSKKWAKLQAVRSGFQSMFPDEQFAVQGIGVESQIADQPFGSEEILCGAINRAENAKLAQPDADYWIGIEGGVEEDEGDLQAFAYVVVFSAQGLSGKSRTASFTLPAQIADLIRAGSELSAAHEIVFGSMDPRGSNSTVAVLTDDVITRISFYTHAVQLALIPFKKPSLYVKG